MAPTPQVNIRAPLEAHESIRRLGELLRRRPDLAPAVEMAVADLERLELDSEAGRPSAGWRVVEELEQAVTDIRRRLEALEEGRRAVAVKAAPPVEGRPNSQLSKLRKQHGLKDK